MVCSIKNILLYLKVLVMSTGILCQVILCLPLVIFLVWVVVQYVGNLKKKKTIIANSNMEAELIALVLESEEAN